MTLLQHGGDNSMFGLDETFTLKDAQKRIKEHTDIILETNVCDQHWVGYVVNQDGAYLPILLEIYECNRGGIEPPTYSYIISDFPAGKRETPMAAFQALNEVITSKLDDLYVDKVL